MKEAHTILCVDDEDSILKSLKRTLQREGYGVLTAITGREGLEILSRKNVDLVISDQKMPEMSGFEFLRDVRKRYPQTLRIMLSGYSDFNSLIKTINEGEILRFIPKPWENEELKKTIRVVLEQNKTICKVMGILEHVQKIFDVSHGLSIETVRKKNTVMLRIFSKDKFSTDKDVYELLNLLFKTFGVENREKLNIISNSISKEGGKIVFDVDLGQGVLLKIEIPPIGDIK